MKDRLKKILIDLKFEKLRKVPVSKMFTGLILNLKWILVGGSIPGRMELCNVCPLNSGNFCEGCTCYIPAKTAVLEETCPIGKW